MKYAVACIVSLTVDARQRPPWHPSFPPQHIVEGGDDWQIAAWLTEHTPPMKLPDHTATPRDLFLARLSAKDYIEERKAGRVTCEEYTRALLKRVQYYEYLNTFMYRESMPQQDDVILQQARQLDAKASREGIDAISPLYGLPVPAKGTMATTDFPSSAGVGILQDQFGLMDAPIVAALRAAHGVVMGKTNVPEFSASFITANYANGVTMNAFNHSLITGGSSGGSASAVAAHLSAVAFSEDTTGSTREPAFQCHVFGYDPSLRHFDSNGVAPATVDVDQVGCVARSFEDILLLDAALLGTSSEHAAAEAAAPSLESIRIGVPEAGVLEYSLDDGSTVHTHESVKDRFGLTRAALERVSVQLVNAELPQWEKTLLDLNYRMWDRASAWLSTWVDPNITMVEVAADFMSMGQGHQPFDMFKSANETTNANDFNHAKRVIANKTALWNSYFNEHHVDIVMTPAQNIEAVSVADLTTATVPTLVSREGEDIEEIGMALWDNIKLFSMWKDTPIPKLSVPTGLDANGKPTGIMLWGRAIPATHLHDADFAKTFDLSFLYTARALVNVLQADARLTRANAPLVADLFRDVVAV